MNLRPLLAQLFSYVLVWFLMGFVFLGLSACTIESSLTDLGVPDVLSGRIIGFKAAHSLATSSENCTAQEIELYQLTSDGKKGELVAKAPLSLDGHYSINGLREKGIRLSNEHLAATDYLLEYNCGQNLYQRFVTQSKGQDLGRATSLLSWIIESRTSANLRDQETSLWEFFYNGLSKVESETQAYSLLSSDSQLRSRFEETFGVSVAALQQASPKIRTLRIPTELSETEASNFQVSSVHWSAEYSQAFLWRLGSEVLSQSSDFTFVPDANSQGRYALQLFIGEDRGDGSIDFSKPYIQRVFDASIKNTKKAKAPEIRLLGSEYTNSTLVDLEMLTGTVIDGRPQNCDSFSHLSLVEDQFPAVGSSPLNPSSYTIDCTEWPTQQLQFELSGEEGPRSMRLWAMDKQGNISKYSEDLTVFLDTTPPKLKFQGLASNLLLQGGQSFEVQWSLVEDNLLAGSLKLEFSSDGGASWAEIFNNGTSEESYAWSVPSLDTTLGKFRLSVVDKAGNEVSLESASTVSIDSTAPLAPALTLTSSGQSRDRTLSFDVICDADQAAVLYSEDSSQPSASHSGWESCAPSKSVLVSAGDGEKVIYGWSKDLAGNVSATSSSVTMTLDQTPPEVLLTSLLGGEYLSGNTAQTPSINQHSVDYSLSDVGVGLADSPVSLSYSVDDGQTWQSILSGSANTGSYLWTVPEINSTTVRLKLQGCDRVGNCGEDISASSFIIDSVAPQAETLNINGGSIITDNFYVNVSLTALDQTTDISHLCIRADSAAPMSSDDCWNTPVFYGVSPGKTISVSGISFLLGFSPGFYSLRAYYKDQAGNISSLTNGGAGTKSVDTKTIEYDPGSAPVIHLITATNNDSLSLQPTSVQTNFNEGSPVYIKWKITDDNELPDSSIDLSYTTDEKTFIPIASDLSNAVTGGCDIGADEFTGCYVWSAPGAPPGYFKVRLTINDSANLTSISSTSGLNTGGFRVLAGNTDTGLGGSASKALFYSYPQNESGDAQSFVVDSNGIFYFKDWERGILKIDPATGLLTSFIPKTGSYTGEGGPATSATLVHPFKLVIDRKDRLYIYDERRILRVDEDGNIRTLIGGGSSTSAGTLATDFLIAPQDMGNQLWRGTFVVAPNGDIYFTEGGTPNFGNGFRLLHYHAADQRVYQMSFSGVGTYENSQEPVSDKRADSITILFNEAGERTEVFAKITGPRVGGRTGHAASFDPETGVSLGDGLHRPRACDTPYGGEYKFVSPKGEVYGFNETCRRIFKLDLSTNTWSTILGTGTRGRCEDGTPALSCANSVEDIFVDSNEQLYFLDNGMIRTVVNGAVKTLFGEALSDAHGKNPLATRFPEIQQIVPSAGDKLVINDHVNGFLWEVSRSGNVVKLAGDGTLNQPRIDREAANSSYAASNWTYAKFIAIDPMTNNIYVNGTGVGGCNQPVYLDRTDGSWKAVMESCGDAYWRSDNTTGSNSYYVHWSALGFNSSNQFIAMTNHWSGVHEHTMAKAFNITASGLQTHYMGSSGGYSGTWASDGTNMSTSNVMPQTAHGGTRLGSYWDAPNSRWLVASNGSGRIAAIPEVDGAGGVISTFTNTVNGMRSFTYRLEAGSSVIYYCANNGRIYRRDVSAGTETQLEWPSSTISCTGRTMSINSNLDRLEFVFEQNGLYGIAEIQLASP